MNIHEHQAKKILKKYGAVVPEGFFGLTVDDLIEKAKSLKTKKYVLKAQIHAGGRGKAGGVKILNNLEELKNSLPYQLPLFVNLPGHFLHLAHYILDTTIFYLQQFEGGILTFALLRQNLVMPVLA